jgi:hypothetical protein
MRIMQVLINLLEIIMRSFYPSYKETWVNDSNKQESALTNNEYEYTVSVNKAEKLHICVLLFESED